MLVVKAAFFNVQAGYEALEQINRVREDNELKVPPGNRLERLKDDRENQYSIRINQQY